MEVRLGKRYFGGLGDIPDRTFNRNSEVKFMNEDIGFLTMPRLDGTEGEIYETKDGGKSFTKINIIEKEGKKITMQYGENKVEILESEIFDYYELPEEKNGKLYLKITQGSDGDYNGNEYREYYSDDMGENWRKSDI